MMQKHTGEFQDLSENDIASLIDSARGDHVLAPYVNEIICHESVADTATTAHILSVRLGGNGQPRDNHLITEISYSAVDYAIPRSEIEAARASDAKSKTTRETMRLRREAASTFTDLANTGEGGEILVFVLAETFLKLPQLMCKMSLKTSGNLHFNGADGLHVGINHESGMLQLYWNESKMFAVDSAAIRECLSSMKPFITGSGSSGAQEERDLHLLNRHLDLDNPDLEEAIKNFLNPRHENFNKLEMCGVGLVGFSCDAYPKVANVLKNEECISLISKEVDRWITLVKSRLEVEGFSNYHIHMFIIPLPCVDKYRDMFLKEIGI